MEYPKINSLYKREGCGPYDESKKRYVCDLEKKKRHSAIIEGEYACPEFESINKWTITEKVDGTNIRVILDRKSCQESGVHRVSFGGRTDNAQLPTTLLGHLQETFTYEKLDEVFKESNYVVLFGEGYGPKIQSGGYYRSDVSFILFDVFCSGWWLNREDVSDIAQKLGIDCTKAMENPSGGHIWKLQDILSFVKTKPISHIAQVEKRSMEGIVARSEPQMMFRKGGPIMFKLKCADFEK